jgi:tetratricopeptide (TPR) repeat protein
LGGESTALLAFTGDGRTVAVADSAQGIKLWGVGTWQELASLAVPDTGQLSWLSFSADGSRLAARTQEGTLHLWDLRLIRARLREMDLDWEPALAASPEDGGGPLRVGVDPGDAVARAKYSLVLAFVPLHAEAYYQRGLAHRRANRWAEALHDFDQALVLNPDHAGAWYEHGLLQAQQGRLPQAVSDFSRALALRPDHAGAYEHRARAHDSLGQLDAALADYTEALARRRGRWDLWNDRGFLYWQQGRWTEGLADFTEGLKAEPTAPEPWFNRGASHLMLGHWQEALDDLVQAVALDDASALAWNSRGVAHAATGRWDRAEADFAQAARRDPTNTRLWHDRALTYLGQGDTDGYRRVCAAALKQCGRPADASAALRLAWTCVLAPRAVSDPTRPVQLARQAVAGAPQDHAAARTYGAALLRAGELRAALRELDRAAALNAEDPTTCLLQALAHHGAGHGSEARRWLAKAAAWVGRASQQRPSDGALSPWQRLPLHERATVEVLRREAESLTGGG